jgi:hypothetical protein
MLHLSPSARAEVLAAVDESRVLGLRPHYSSGVNDGSQWVLWVRQGGYEKAIYFDNRFPAAVRQFADELDRILAANGLEAAEWTLVSEAESRNHEKELWGSIRRLP